MIQCIILDLSEVLIAGLVGIEKELAGELGLPQAQVLSRFGGPLMDELFLGNITEEAYLRATAEREGWDIRLDRLKAVIRANFRGEVEGTLPIVVRLARRYRVVLMSDHAREWIAYIRSVHSFFGLFERTFFSYDLKRTKRDQRAYLAVLDVVSLRAPECLLIDDYHRNIATAEGLGIPCIQFRTAGQLEAELKAMAALD